MLIKDEDKPKADVIDGQQRLTTLTILIAVIASYLTGENQSNCKKYLRESGNYLEDLAPLPRLHLRQKDQEFFNKYIQNVNLSDLISLDPENLPNESQQHIRSNCALIIKRWMTHSTETKIKLKILQISSDKMLSCCCLHTKPAICISCVFCYE